MEKAQAYCPTCKDERYAYSVAYTSENGQITMNGRCEVCGTRISKIVNSKSKPKKP